MPKNRFASLRIDYLLERVSPGKARVWTGEVGELGRLGWFLPPQDLRNVGGFSQMAMSQYLLIPFLEG